MLQIFRRAKFSHNPLWSHKHAYNKASFQTADLFSNLYVKIMILLFKHIFIVNEVSLSKC